jgi:predicted flap endonuclease-1-like 5' DNA nuclease
MISDAIEYPLEGDDALERLVIGGVVYLASSFFVIPAILIGGYSIAVTRALIEGRDAPPAFEDWWQYARDGLYVAAIALLYSLPGLVLAGVGIVVSLVLGFLLGSDGGGVLMVPIVAMLMIGGFAYSLVYTYVLPAAMVNFARTDDIGAAWDVDALRTVLTDGAYAKAWIVAVVLLFVVNSVGGMLTVFVVGFLVFFYGQVAAMYLYTNGAMDALGISPAPPKPPSSAERSATDASGAGDEGVADAAGGGADAASDAANATGGGADAADESTDAADEGTRDDDAAAPADVDDGTTPSDLEGVSGIGPTTAESLRSAGFESVGDLRAASRDDLTAVEGIGPAKADRIKRDVGDS